MTDRNDRAVELHARAQERLAASDLAKAQSLCEEALRLFVRQQGAGCPDAANVRNSLGDILEQMGQLPRAFRLYRCSLRAISAWIRPHCRMERAVLQIFVQSLRRHGRALRLQARYGEAERLLGHAVSVARRRLGRGEDTAWCLNELGMLYKYWGRPARARRCYLRALAMLGECLSDDHPSLANLYHNLGGAWHAEGRFAEAEGPARESVARRVRALGERHPLVAADRAALGAILAAQGRSAEAEPMFHAAISVWLRIARDHPDLGPTLHNLATLYSVTGRPRLALHYFKLALKTKTAIYGPRHPAVGLTLNNVGATLLEIGELAAARQHLRQAATALRSLPFTHPHRSACRSHLARLRLACVTHKPR